MVNVDDKTACFAFVEMKQRGARTPAVVLGGFQMENNLLSFDLEKKQLGFAVLPWYATSFTKMG
nr:unnamed protein product [Digitaria exilis]